MFRFLLRNNTLLSKCRSDTLSYLNCRTFLSQAYYCQEVWDQRLNSPILQKTNLDELYHELDQRFQKTRQISAVDVDIFSNSIQDDSYVDEMLDIIHKLRLSADTRNTLESTSHAVVRTLLKHGKYEDLVNALDDRLNYGLFLDYYTANILLDTLWKAQEYASGARVASQMMLQEEFDHPLTKSLSILHCYKYLLEPKGWPEYQPPSEPEDEVKIRVKYLRNPYNDNHFDLRDPTKIIGKTLYIITKGNDDPLNKSFNILGLALFGECAQKVLNECKNKSIPLYNEVLDLLPADNEVKAQLEGIQIESKDVLKLLMSYVEKAEQQSSEQDISHQCKIYTAWENERSKALKQQLERLSNAKRLKNIEDIEKAIKEKETKLWFFENEENIELAINAKQVFYPKRWFGKKKAPKKIDEGYVPPEIHSKQTNPHQY